MADRWDPLKEGADCYFDSLSERREKDREAGCILLIRLHGL